MVLGQGHHVTEVVCGKQQKTMHRATKIAVGLAAQLLSQQYSIRVAMMKMVDSDTLCAGKVWRTAWKVWKTLQADELKYPKFAAAM